MFNKYQFYKVYTDERVKSILVTFILFIYIILYMLARFLLIPRKILIGTVLLCKIEYLL